METPVNIIYDPTSCHIAVFFAISFSLIGTFVNIVALATIRRRNVRDKSIGPLIFLQSLCNLIACAIWLPTLAIRYHMREDFKDLVDGFCEFLAIIYYGIGLGIKFLLLALIGLHRALHFHGYDKIVFTWKKTLLYIVVIIIIRIIFLIFPLTKFWGQVKYEEKVFNCALESLGFHSSRYVKSGFKMFYINIIFLSAMITKASISTVIYLIQSVF